jgi:endo-1,4-beta-xylanase
VYLPASDKATGAAVVVAPGGGHVRLAIQQAGAAQPNAGDPLDRPSARPDFHGLIYPGQSQKIQPSKESPPALFACGYADRPDISEGLAKVYLLYKQAGVPADLHVYAGAGHGFGVRETNKSPSGTGPEAFRAFLVDRKFIAAAP